MKKFNILTIAALSMAISLLSGCTGNKKDDDQPIDPPTPPVVDKFEEVSYNDYMAALEGKDFNDAYYEKCLINGSVKAYGEATPLAEFNNEPVRFMGEITRPVIRPQNSTPVSEYAMNYVMAFATYWSEDDEAVYYLNKNNEQTPYMVEKTEYVAEDVTAKVTFVYNKDGLALSIKSVANSAPVDPLINCALDVRPLKDLTFTWCEKDTIDSYQRVSYDAFKEKAQAFEGAECEYLSGHANGTVGYCNSEVIVTLENDLLIPSSSDKFESAKNRDLLIELFHNRASYTSNYDTYYFYYSESLDTLMAIMNMASGGDVLERVIVWNNNGLPTSVKDTKYGSCSTFSSMKVYDLTFTYSKEAATITLTILSGVGAWADGATQKVITANVGSYLGNVMSTFTMPTAEGMTIYGSSLARENGRLIHYSEKIYDDMTLTIPFYNNAGSPSILTFVEPSSIKFTMQGFASDQPMIAYLTDSSNDGFYFASGAKQTLEYTFKDTKAPASTKTIYFYGANVALGDENGLFHKGNASLVSLSLNGNATVGDYAYAKTGVTEVAVYADGLDTVGAHAFENCEELTALHCGYIYNIGAYAFANSGLNGLFVAAAEAETIGENAFNGCDDLVGVITPSEVTYDTTYMENKVNFVIPGGWDSNWNGGAQKVARVNNDSFKHEGADINIGGFVGSVTTKQIFTMLLSNISKYSSYISADGDCKVTLKSGDGTVIDYVESGTDYYKTVESIEGGQWLVVEVVALSNQSAHFTFNIKESLEGKVSVNYNSSDYILANSGDKTFDPSSIVGSQSFIYIDDYGTAANAEAFASLISGKIVLVNRGSIPFSEKGNNLDAKGAKAILCVNNSDEMISISLSAYTGSAPFYLAPLSLGTGIKANATKQSLNGVDYYIGTFTLTSN